MKRSAQVVAVRRCVQLAVIALLVALPILSQYGHFRAAHAIENLEGTWRGTVFTWLEHTVGALPDPEGFLDKFLGGLWSMKFFGVSISDPLAVLDMTAASRAWHPALWTAVVIPVLLSMALGRVFCAWLCPMHLFLEIANGARALLKWAELPVRDLRFSYGTKYVALGFGLAAAAVVGAPLMALVYPPAVIGRELQVGIRMGALTSGMYLLCGIALFEILVSRRWWCRYICPGGAVYSALGRFRLIRVQRTAETCTACGDCIPACEMGLRPMLDKMGMECDNCGDCVKACPEGSLAWVITQTDLQQPGVYAEGFAPHLSTPTGTNGAAAVAAAPMVEREYATATTAKDIV